MGIIISIIGDASLFAADIKARRAYDLPASDVANALKLFSEQSGRGVIAGTDLVKGVRTNPVRGELTASEALNRMLAGTGLAGVEDARSGTFAVRKETATGKNAAPETPSDRSRESQKKNETAPPQPQAPMKQNSFVARLTATLALMVASAGAQTEPAANVSAGSSSTNAVVELSPFIVSSDAETGWVATETLSGSRLRTNLKDVPNQIETLTKEFMLDLGLNSLDEALIYTANTENSSEYVAATTGGQAVRMDAGRVRGLNSATLSRNFFQTYTPTDSYNIDRVTVASGPNAILFGLGSPSGILDATPARPQMRNLFGVNFQYDTNESRRGSFDLNRVLLPDKLAFRLMGLSKTGYVARKPNFDRDDRIYGAVTVKPTKTTTITFQGERDNRDWSRGTRVPPADFVTPWLIANQIHGSGYTTPKPLYNNTSFTGINSNPIFVQASESPVFVQGGSVQPMSWRNSVQVRSPSTLPGVEPTFDRAQVFSLVDPSIFPFDVNPVGLSRTTEMRGDIKTLIVEQKLTNGLFLELAYNREKSERSQLSAGGTASGNNFRIDVDPNLYLPGTTAPNPHAGELHITGGMLSQYIYTDAEDRRATLSYEFDVGRHLSDRWPWAKWLGRHRFSGLYASSIVETATQNFERAILDDPVITGLTLRPKTFQNWASHATRRPQWRHYLGDPYQATQPMGGFREDWTLVDRNGTPYTLYANVTPLRAADGKRLGGSGAVGGAKNAIESLIFAWQGFFFKDRQGLERLVLTYGYRRDSARSASFDNASVAQDFSGLFPVIWDADWAGYHAKQSGVNRNTGVVARPLRWLSLSYNQSTTFDLNIGRYDPFGNDIPGANGKGRDYAVRIDVLENRLSLKVNKYENTLGPRRSANQINTYRNQFRNVENRVLELNAGTPQINVTDGNRRGFPAAPFNDYNISSDFEASGYEAEINFSPTKNWNFRLNGAKSSSVESNIAAEWFEWLKLRAPVWQSVVATNGEVDSRGNPVTWNTAPFSATNPTGQTLKEYYETSVSGQAVGFITALDGRANPGTRGYRANAIVNYRFDRGRLRGLNLGGALRWRSAPTIGYGVKTDADGRTLLDLAQSYKGKQETYLDLAIGYQGRVKGFGNPRYRIQVNVRNALDADDPFPSGALTTGGIYQVGLPEPRVVQFSLGLDY